MKHFYLLFIVIFFYGCHFGEKKEYIGDIRVFRLENSDSRLLSAVIDSVSFIPLVEQDSFLFGRIDKLLMQGEYIYLMDAYIGRAILVFDKTGAFVRKIGKTGQGPGEYNILYDFDVDSEHIYVSDNLRRILKYDLQGNYIETKRLPFHVSGFKVLKNQKYLFVLSEAKNRKYQIVRTDSNLNVETSFVPFPFEINGNRSQINRNNILQTIDDAIFYNSFFSDTIYSFSNEGDFTGGVLFDFGQKALPERLRIDTDAFAMGTEKGDYNYFSDTPFKVNQFWIGQMANEGTNAAFVYDNTSDKYYFYRMELDYTYLNLPVFANSKYIIGWMDMRFYEQLKNKPQLNGSIMAILEEGGYILSFYHLKQKR